MAPFYLGHGVVSYTLLARSDQWSDGMVCVCTICTRVQTTFHIRVFHAIGIQVLLVTNASGSLRSDYRAGDIMIIKDHINLPGFVCLNPLVGLNDVR